MEQVFEVMRAEVERRRLFIRRWMFRAKKERLSRSGRMNKWMLSGLREILRNQGRLTGKEIRRVR